MRERDRDFSGDFESGSSARALVLVGGGAMASGDGGCGDGSADGADVFGVTKRGQETPLGLRDRGRGMGIVPVERK